MLAAGLLLLESSGSRAGAAPGPLGQGAEVGFLKAKNVLQGKCSSVRRRSWRGSVLSGQSSVEEGGEFFRHGDADKGWVRLTARKLGMSSRAGVKGCGAGPGVSLYLVVTFFAEGGGEFLLVRGC